MADQKILGMILLYISNTRKWHSSDRLPTWQPACPPA